MTSSSIIVMPQTLNEGVSGRSSSHGTPVTAPSKPPTETDDSVSEAGSDTSSISLVSIPGSLEDDDEAEWQDSRDVPTGNVPETEEYVVLYDDHSSEED